MDDFQIIEKLGDGTYSTVYKVKRLIDGNFYALKKVKLINLSEKERENSLNEVRLLASIKSNFVISYKEAFFNEKDSTLSIVMEFADKGDLYQKIAEYKKNRILFDESDIWRIFIQIVKGLKALHELNILHRDLKSANIFLMSNGSAKLGDLNVSKVIKKGLGYTQTGTPYYASPEVWNDKPYNHKSDIWSLGCVLYEMITLKPPFRAKNMNDLYKKVTEGKLSKLPNKFSNDLFQIIKLLLQINSELRPSCDEILSHPIIKKRLEYFNSFTGDDISEDKSLLQTIHIPNNFLFLSDKLPKPNYERNLNNKFGGTNLNNTQNLDCSNKKINPLIKEYTEKEPNKFNEITQTNQKITTKNEITNKDNNKNFESNNSHILVQKEILLKQKNILISSRDIIYNIKNLISTKKPSNLLLKNYYSMVKSLSNKSLEMKSSSIKELPKINKLKNSNSDIKKNFYNINSNSDNKIIKKLIINSIKSSNIKHINQYYSPDNNKQQIIKFNLLRKKYLSPNNESINKKFGIHLDNRMKISNNIYNNNILKNKKEKNIFNDSKNIYEKTNKPYLKLFPIQKNSFNLS